MRIVAVHGWGLDSRIWSPLIARLQQCNPEFEVDCLDLGFFGEERIPAGTYDVAIGHSFGLQWLLYQENISFKRVVSICGFTRFFKGRDFPFGTHPRVLSRMQENSRTDASSQLRRFWDEAGGDLLDLGIEVENADIDRLTWGLGGLKSWDLREQWSNQDIPEHHRLIIAASDDSIVAPELTKACFGHHQIKWIESNCHLIPIAETELCASLIQNLIQA